MADAVRLMHTLLNRINAMEGLLHQEIKLGQQVRSQHEARLCHLESQLLGQTSPKFEDAPPADAAGVGHGQNTHVQSITKELDDIRTWQSRIEAEQPNVHARFHHTVSLEDLGNPSLEVAMMQYSLEPSMYDSMLLIQLPNVAGQSSIITMFAFLLLLIMLTITSLVISEDTFTDEVFKDHFQVRLWRASDAHTERLTDGLRQTPLVARVCNEDAGLSVASSQIRLVHDARKYLEAGGGTALCNVAVFLWVCCCAIEIRKSMNFVLAVCSISRSWTTRISSDDDGFAFTEVSPYRFMLGGFVGFFRLFMAGFLAWYGSYWLATTGGLEDLLLNASALSFVLDIDEILYALFAPRHMEMLVHGWKPLKITTVHILKMKHKMLLFCVMVFMVCVNVWPISETRTQMRDAQRLLCDPPHSHQLVQAVNSLGWVVYTRNSKSWEEGSNAGQVERQIVADLLDNPSEGEKHAYEVSDLSGVREGAIRSVAEFVNSFGCRDLNTVNITKTTLGRRLWAATGNISLTGITSCQDAKHYCRDLSKVGINVRFLCAVTCGCSDYHSGLWDLSQARYGCPYTSCQAKLQRALKSITECRDLSLAELKKTEWQNMLDRMMSLKDISEAQYLNMTNLGCKAIPKTNTLDVCAISGTSESHGAGAFCPESCLCSSAKTLGAKDDCGGMCPRHCCHKGF